MTEQEQNDSALLDPATVPAEDQEELEKSMQENTEHNLEVRMRIPPDLQHSELHARACMMKQTELLNQKWEECSCCGKPIDPPLFELCEDPQAFRAYGKGVSLYYLMLREFSLLLLHVFLLEMVCVIGYYYFYIESSTEPLDIPSTVPFLARISVGQFGLAHMQCCYVLLATAAVLGYYMLWRTHSGFFMQTSIALQTNSRTPSHYTVMVSGVPTGANLDEADFLKVVIEDRFKTKGLARAAFARDLSEFARLQFELQQTQEKLARYRAFRNTRRGSYVNKTNKEPTEEDVKGFDRRLARILGIENFDALLDKEKGLRARLETALTAIPRAPVAFATFHFAKECYEVVQTNKVNASWLKQLLGFSNVRYKGRSIYVERAAEPEDVFWENLSVTVRARLCRQMLVFVLSLGVFALSFIGNYYVFRMKQSLNNNEESGFTKLVLMLAPIVLTVGINEVMKATVPTLVKYERTATKTDHDIGVAYKLSLGIFLNSAVLPFVAPIMAATGHSLKELLWDDKIMDTIFLNLLVIILAPPLTELVHPKYLWHLYKVSQLKSKGSNVLITQLEANTIFEPPQINFSRKYGENLAIVLAAGFYAPLFPPGVLLATLGLMVRYWIDKYLMLRRYKRPVPLGPEIAEWTYKNAIGFVAVVLVSQIILVLLPLGKIEVEYEEDSGFVTVLRVILPLLIFCAGLLITKSFMGLCHNRQDFFYRTFVDDPTGEKVFVERFAEPYLITDFEKDYRYMNPISHAEARKEYAQAYKDKNDEEEKRAEVEKGFSSKVSPCTSPVSTTSLQQPTAEPAPLVASQPLPPEAQPSAVSGTVSPEPQPSMYVPSPPGSAYDPIGQQPPPPQMSSYVTMPQPNVQSQYQFAHPRPVYQPRSDYYGYVPQSQQYQLPQSYYYH